MTVRVGEQATQRDPNFVARHLGEQGAKLRFRHVLPIHPPRKIGGAEPRELAARARQFPRLSFEKLERLCTPILTDVVEDHPNRGVQALVDPEARRGEEFRLHEVMVRTRDIEHQIEGEMWLAVRQHAEKLQPARASVAPGSSRG